MIADQLSACSPSLESVNDAGDSVLSIACTRGHIDVIDYLVKDKGYDLDGEITVLCTLVCIMAWLGGTLCPHSLHHCSCS